ncbi:MAG: FecR domain-containing protein [Verrucomicrobia bacterium]|nr:FecR domain-containing protein [Verrucomicrobiota bacterium]
MKPPTAELRALIDKLLDEGPLSRVETSRLEELLHDPEAMRYYNETMAGEVMLGQVLGEMPEIIAPPARRRFPWVAVWLPAAACLAFFAGRWTHEPLPPETTATPPPRAPVQVTGVVGVSWQPDAGPGLQAGAAVAQRLAFRTGLVELTYPDGVCVTLEGPADFSVGDGRTSSLAFGKLVAHVPHGAEGFTVKFPDGKVVDLGTEFGLDVQANGRTELGVFDGEVKLHLDDESQGRPLFANQAVIRGDQDGKALRAVPFDRGKFVRRLPARDFPWMLDSTAPKEIEIDVSHLVWKPSRYCAIFKWIGGQDAIHVSDVRLLLDGKPVVADPHTGTTGFLHLVKDNMYHLEVPSEAYARGRWTIRATVRPMPRLDPGDTKPVKSEGILQFEEGLVDHAAEADFIGRWSYHYLGTRFVREFHPDGTASLVSSDGANHPDFPSARWHVEKGVLYLNYPTISRTEAHVLRDKETLIFTTNSYDNAKKEAPAKADGSR